MDSRRRRIFQIIVSPPSPARGEIHVREKSAENNEDAVRPSLLELALESAYALMFSLEEF
jgi:hypothetical protein